MWSDEYITLRTLTENPITNPFYQGVTTNLPLYFWCLKLMSVFTGTGNVSLFRWFGIVTNVLTGVFLFRKISKTQQSPVATMFLTVFLFSPLQIHYSAELRPYALCQLLAAILFILILNKPQTTKRILIINTVTILGLLCHYSFYIFFVAVIAFLLSRRTNLEALTKCFFMPFIVACFIGIIYFANPLFKESLVGSNLGRKNSTFVSRLVQTENLSRIKEAVSNYYYYGLYYYRLDFWAQFILKKVLLALFVIGVWLAVKTKKSNTALFGAFTILSIALVVSMVGEKAGYYPFGGRHIMPFSFLLYVMVAFSLEWVSKFKYAGKMIVGILMSLLLFSFISFQVCSHKHSQRYTGTNDPQGDIYTYCLGMLTK